MFADSFCLERPLVHALVQQRNYKEWWWPCSHVFIHSAESISKLRTSKDETASFDV